MATATFAAAALAAACALWATLASAQPQPQPPPRPDATRAALEEHARDANQAAEYREALDTLRALARLPGADPKTFCALGLRARREGSYLEAAKALEVCVQAARRHPPTTDQEKASVDFIAGELEAARSQVAALTVSAPVGAALTVDGVDEPTEAIVYVAPGIAHPVAITRGGETSSAEVTIPIGRARHIMLDFPAPPPAPVPPPPAPLRPRPRIVDDLKIPMLVAGIAASAFTTMAASMAVAKADEAEGFRAAAENGHPRACNNIFNALDTCLGYSAATYSATAWRNVAIGSGVATAALFGFALTVHWTDPTDTPAVTIAGRLGGAQ